MCPSYRTYHIVILIASILLYSINCSMCFLPPLHPFVIALPFTPRTQYHSSLLSRHLLRRDSPPASSFLIQIRRVYEMHSLAVGTSIPSKLGSCIDKSIDIPIPGSLCKPNSSSRFLCIARYSINHRAKVAQRELGCRHHLGRSLPLVAALARNSTSKVTYSVY